MAGFLALVTDWAIRGVVLVSLCAHVVLALFASIRRREGSGVWTVVLWVAYQVADWATPFVLSNLSLGSTSREQHLVALWLPFLLAHLGGPDNITAYSFDDNKVSLRQVIGTFLRFQGISFAIYKQYTIVGTSSKGALFWASAVMVAVGIAKYVERVRALRNGDFGNIRSAGKNQQRKGSLRVRSQHGRRSSSRKLLSNEQALLVAHELLHVTKGAFADYSVRLSTSDVTKLRRQVFPVEGNIGWDNICKVVEMELSLMYDILYTKSAKIHSRWEGYLIRVLSPFATVTMALAFLFHDKGGQRKADVIITYILLGVTFLLEVRWLLRVAASTWTYAFFNAGAGAAQESSCWLQRQVVCSGRWHRLRRAIVSVDPRQLLLKEPRGTYRLWSGYIGQFNLFDECTRDTTSLWGSLVTMVASEDTWVEHNHSERRKLGKPNCNSDSGEIRKLLFRQIRETLKKAYSRRKMEKEAAEKEVLLAPRDGDSESDYDMQTERRHLLDVALGFVPEFQELILILHVATDVFLVSDHGHFSKADTVTKEAIVAMSDYMTFLAAARPDMLPGLNLRSLYNETREELGRIWETAAAGGSSSKHTLACILRGMEKNKRHGNLVSKSELQDKSFILSEGVIIAEVLLAVLDPLFSEEIIHQLLGVDSNMIDDDFIRNNKDSKWRKRILFLIKLLIPNLEDRNQQQRPYEIGELLELLLSSWVRLLINVSTRCGRDSHAKQLGRGCELTTIVWVLGEHASIFGI